MLFSSRVAENANRRSRLVFDTPEPVLPPILSEEKTATESTELNAQGMPSWASDSANPFGADPPIPPLRIPSSGSATSSVSANISSDSVYSHSDNADADTETSPESHHVSHTSRLLRALRKKETCAVGSESYTSEREKVMARRSDVRALPHKDYPRVSGNAPVIPLPAMLLAGTAGMPMLSTLANGVLVNRIPNGMSEDGKNITVAVALPAQADGDGEKNRAPQSREHNGLSEGDVPFSPIDPFGETRAGEDVFPLPAGEAKKSPVRIAVIPPDEQNDDARNINEVPLSSGRGIRGTEGARFLAPPLFDMPKLQRYDTAGAPGVVPANTPASINAARPPILPRHHSFLEVPRQPILPVRARRTKSESGFDRSQDINIWDSSLLPAGARISEEETRSNSHSKQKPTLQGRRAYSESDFDRSSEVNLWDPSLLPAAARITEDGKNPSAEVKEINRVARRSKAKRAPTLRGRRAYSESAFDRSNEINFWDISLLPAGARVSKPEKIGSTGIEEIPRTPPVDSQLSADPLGKSLYGSNNPPGQNPQQQQQGQIRRKGLRETVIGKIRKLRQHKLKKPFTK